MSWRQRPVVIGAPYPPSIFDDEKRVYELTARCIVDAAGLAWLQMSKQMKVTIKREGVESSFTGSLRKVSETAVYYLHYYVEVEIKN